MKKALVAVAVVALTPVLLVGILMAAVLSDASASTSSTLKGVPADFEPWIQQAAQECRFAELTPALLAAQLNQESHFSTSRTEVSSAGAMGPAQFTPDTWATWGRDEDGKNGSNPFDVADAVMAQGRMMCSLLGQAKASPFAGDVRGLALAGYNAGWGAVVRYRGIPPYEETRHYVQVILDSIKDFDGTGNLPAAQIAGRGSGPDAVRRAASQIGLPYSWGGGSPAGPSTGFCDGTNGYLHGQCSASVTVGWDCSSLVQYAYWPSITLPRTASAQYGATSARPVAKADLQVGDLLFWSHGGDASIYHVALYAGAGMMVEAPRTGQSVKLAPLSAMPAGDYFGATRP